MLHVKTITCNPFQENTYLLYDESREAVIVDCGALVESEEREIASFVESNQLKVKYLLNTHLHLDHAFGNAFAVQHYGVDLCAHQADEFLIGQMQSQALMFGLNVPVVPQPLTRYLNDGDQLVFGGVTLEAIHVPGHSPGSVCFYDAASAQIFTGDVLFRGSIGRTDLPKGDYDLLIEGIRTKLMTLPEDVVVYSGHGPQTSIGYEKENNPFL